MQDSLSVLKIRTCKGGQLVATEELLRQEKFEPHGTLHWFLGNILGFTPTFPKMQDSLSVFKIRTCKGCQLVATEELLRHGKFEPHGTLHWFLGNIEKKGQQPCEAGRWSEKAGRGAWGIPQSRRPGRRMLLLDFSRVHLLQSKQV